MTMAAFLRGKPIMQPYSVGAGSCNAGDVIVVNNLPCVAHEDIPAFTGGETLDAVAVSGGIYQIPADAAYPDGTYVLWNSSGQQVTTVAVAGQTFPFGWIVGGPTDLTSDNGPTGAASLCSVLHHPVPSAVASKGTPEINTNVATVGAATLSAAAIAGGVITRSGSTGAYSDTTDTAAHIIAALADPVPGESFQLKIKNTVAFAETLLAGTNVTLSGETIIPPLSVGVFLVTYVSATSVTIQGLFIAPLTAPPILAVGTLTTVGAGTILGAVIAGGFVLRTGSTAAFTDTTDIAANIIAAIPNASVGQSWEFTYINNTEGVATLTGGTGVNAAATFAAVGIGGWVTVLFTYTAANTITTALVAGGTNIGLPKFQYATGTTTTTFTAGELTGAENVFYTSTAATPGSIATRTATQMFGDIPGAYVGMSWLVTIVNDAATNSLTVTAGMGVTLAGKTTYVATPYGTLTFLMTFTSATTLNMTYVNGGQSTTV